MEFWSAPLLRAPGFEDEDGEGDENESPGYGS